MNQYYAIKAPDGTLLYHTVSVTEKDSIRKAGGDTTNYWHNNGYRCVKVEIKEIV